MLKNCYTDIWKWKKSPIFHICIGTLVLKNQALFFEKQSTMHTIALKTNLPPCYAEVVMLLFQCIVDWEFNLITYIPDSYAWENQLKKE